VLDGAARLKTLFRRTARLDCGSRDGPTHAISMGPTTFYNMPLARRSAMIGMGPNLTPVRIAGTDASPWGRVRAHDVSGGGRTRI